MVFGEVYGVVIYDVVEICVWVEVVVDGLFELELIVGVCGFV